MAECVEKLLLNCPSPQPNFNINAIPEVSNISSLNRLPDYKYVQLEKAFGKLDTTSNKKLLRSHKVKRIGQNLYSYRIDRWNRIIYGEKDNVKTFLDFIVKYDDRPWYVKNSNLISKRILDIIGCIFGLTLTLILLLFIAPAIKIESRGPIFNKQTRMGKNGKPFTLYKFRSMYIDAEQRKKELMQQNEMNVLMFKMRHDPRITKVGKFLRKTSLDELPNFINVLKGEMSLVGVRPPTKQEVEQYEDRHKKRLTLKPGITGIWQISRRSDITDFEDVIKMDLDYIENWTIFMDLKILMKTVLPFLRKKSYYNCR